MSIIITPDFVPENHPIRSIRAMKPKWISLHETANRNRGADDIMHGQYIKSPAAVDRTVLWHFTVDQDSIRQHIPVREVGWHAGDGWGPGNMESVAIEMCVNEDGDYFATLRLTAALVAHLVRTEPSLLPFPECLVQHNRWSGKDCPHVLRSIPGGWNSFIGMVWNELRAPVETPVATVKVLVDGEAVECKGRIEDGRTVARLAPVVDAMGGKFAWDGATRILSILSPKPVQKKHPPDVTPV